MIAVRVSPDVRPAVVASPDYFRAHGRPGVPGDLLRHRCINFRHRGEGVYRWELDRGDQSVAVAVNGSLILDDSTWSSMPRWTEREWRSWARIARRRT